VADDPVIQPVDDTRPPGTTGAPTSAPIAPPDRRRPGRMQYASRALIALLRTPSELRTTETERDHDNLATAKGIVSGVLLSIPIWGAIGLLGVVFPESLIRLRHDREPGAPALQADASRRRSRPRKRPPRRGPSLWEAGRTGAVMITRAV
jgi:hypothetical protein